MNDVTVRLRDVVVTLEDLRSPIEEEERLDQVLDRLTESATGQDQHRGNE